PYATVGVRDPYTSSLSIPVFGTEDKFVGALTLSGPTARINASDKQALATLLTRSADRIARALGASQLKREAVYR
ncbi:MAG TPA: IclR family transcriptional regulator C-terminal domain-containing protein, partial [Nitrosospira sp.]|nr:IclR family transcriptional regulator C-terminal domain-containing protein [Nitrosospira sp.]